MSHTEWTKALWGLCAGCILKARTFHSIFIQQALRSGPGLESRCQPPPADWQSQSLGTRQPDHESQTTHCSGQAFAHRSQISVQENVRGNRNDTRRTLFTSCLQTLDMYTAPLQIIYRAKPSPDTGYIYPCELFFPSRLHKSQHSQQLPSPIVVSAATLTRQHLHRSLTASLLSCFCILPEASPLFPVPRHLPSDLKILILRLKGLRSALLPFPVHSG